MLSCKNWQGGDELLLKMVQHIVTLSNRVTARTGFVLRAELGTRYFKRSGAAAAAIWQKKQRHCRLSLLK